MPGQRREVQPRYGRLDWQTLPLDSTTAQWFWQQLGATEPNAPDTVAAAQPAPVQQGTVPPPPPSVQQPTSTGAQATNTGTGTTPPATPPPTSQPAPAPGVARRGATKLSLPQQSLQNTYQLALASQQAQRIGIESAMQPVPVPEPVGEKIESQLQRSSDYIATLDSLIRQTLEGGYQPFTFWLGAAIPATSSAEALGLVRDIQPLVREHLQRLQAQSGDTQPATQVSRLQKLLTAFSNDENLRSAIMQEARRLLETAIQSKPELAQYYEGLVGNLKAEEAWLQQQISRIPENLRVMTNQNFVSLYNRYLQVQRDIMNTAALVAANNNVRINWQNLLDHAIANLARPAFDLIQQLPLAVPSYDAVGNVWRELQEQVKDNEKLKPALEKLKAIRAYSGRRLSIEDSAEVARLHQQYVEALRQAGLDDETVDRLSRIVYQPGSLPGLGWSSGPIVEPAQPIIGFLQPAQLGGAQLPNVEAPVPTSRGSRGSGRTPQLRVSLRSSLGFDRPTVDASTRDALRNSLAELQNVAGAAYLPLGDINWRPILRLLGGNEDAEITFSGVRFAPTSIKYEELVDNFRKILTSQPEGAYRAAVKEDITAYLGALVESAGRSSPDMAENLNKVRILFMKRPVEIAYMLKQAVNDPPALFARFLEQLRRWLQHDPRIENANAVLEALQHQEVREALHAAITSGIARYISLKLKAIAVGRNTITDHQIVPGIAGMLLGNLHRIVSFQ
jgi:hypothetical protein